MNLPKRRPKIRMGVRKTVETVWPRHRRFVKSHGCCVPGCTHLAGGLYAIIDFAHVKSRGAGGTDLFGVSLCRFHHGEQHEIGIRSFQKRHGIDLWALALAFSRKSPEPKVREAMKLIAVELTGAE